MHVKKAVYLAIGLLCLGIGSVGIVLPILPTVPFFLVSSFCFMKSSEKLDKWFKNTKVYKKHVLRFKEQKGMTLKAKLCILIPVYIMLLTLFFLKDILAMRITIAALLALKTIVFIRIKTIKETDLINDKQEIDEALWEK